MGRKGGKKPTPSGKKVAGSEDANGSGGLVPIHVKLSPLYVRGLPGGKMDRIETLSVSVAEETIAHVRARMQIKLDIRTETQAMSFAGMQLEDPRATIYKIGMKRGSTLHLDVVKAKVLPPTTGTFYIFVLRDEQASSGTARTEALKVNRFATIASVKAQLETCLGVPSRRQSLFQTKSTEPLDDTMTMETIGLRPESLLHLEELEP